MQTSNTFISTLQKIIAVFVLIHVGFAVQAQQALTLKEAIQTALKNSYNIQLVENTVAIAKNNNYIGVAGGLPTVTSTVNNNKSLSTIEQRFADPTRNTTKTGVDGNTLTAGLTASVIIFNGYRVMATKDRLATIEKQSEQQLQAQLANTTATVMQQYYNIIRQQAYLKTIEKSIEASKQRLDIVKTRQQIGVANQADLLQSNLDLNALIQGKQNQLLIIDQAKADLLNTMVLPSSTPIMIQEDITVDTKIKLAEVVLCLNKIKNMTTRVLTTTTARRDFGALTDVSKELNQMFGDKSGRTVSMRTTHGFKDAFSSRRNLKLFYFL